MKKQLLCVAMACVGFSTLKAQSVPNGNFEAWTNHTYDILTGYDQNSNLRSLQNIGMNTALKSTDFFHASFAAKVVTLSDGKDTAAGYFAIGNPGGGNPKGGTPYADRPTSLHGNFKCAVPLGDSAIIIVMLKKAGVLIAGATKKFVGTTSTYTAFDLPITMPPIISSDTLVFGFASSNIAGSGNFKGFPGSMLQLDSLTFKGVSAQPAAFNGDFENWTTGTYLTLNNWKLNGDSAKRTPVAYAGNYALSLLVQASNGGGGGVWSNSATTGRFGSNGPPRGGYPFTLMNDSLIGWYKLIANGNDSASISANCSKLGAGVGGFYKPLKPVGVYTRFSFPITCSMAPDTIRIDINSAYRYPVPVANIGSKLYIDEVQLKSQLLNTSAPSIFSSKGSLAAYPNPSNGIFTLSYVSASRLPVVLKAYNEAGQLVYSEEFNGMNLTNTQVDLSQFGKGIYILRTTQGDVSAARLVVVQ